MNKKHAAQLFAVLAIAAGGGAYYALGAHPSRSPAQPASETKPAAPSVAIEAAEVSMGPSAQALSLSGPIAAWQEASIATTGQGLRITELKAEAGDRVVQGQVLAILDEETIAAELAQQRAGVAEAKAALVDADATNARAKSLLEQGFFSAQQAQNSFAAKQAAVARLAAASAAARLSQARLGSSRLVAPDDGVVSARSASLGQVPPPGQELFRVIRQGRLEWRAEVPSADMAKVRPGMAAVATTPSGAKVSGTVRRVSNTVDAGSRNGVAYIDLDAQPGGAAAPGMFASGSIALFEQSAPCFPASALVARDGATAVFKIGPDSKARLVKIKLLSREGERACAQGLAAGDLVAASGAGFLGDGDAVRVMATAKPAAPRAADPVAKPAPESGAGEKAGSEASEPVALKAAEAARPEAPQRPPEEAATAVEKTPSDGGASK